MMTRGADASDVVTTDHDAILAELFRLHHRSLVRTASLLLDDPTVAEEVVQDAYVKLHGALGRLGGEPAALPYLRTTVLNLARSRLRRRLVALRHPPAAALDAAGADEGALAGADHRAVVAALRRLPARQRECLVLRWYLDLPEAEIASTLGISGGSVKTHLHRGLAALSTLLEELR